MLKTLCQPNLKIKNNTMDKKVNKILILSLAEQKPSPEIIPLKSYEKRLKAYFDQKEDCQTEFVVLYSPPVFKRLRYINKIIFLLRIFFYKNEKEFDYGFIQLPILAKALANSKAKKKVCIIHDLRDIKNSKRWTRPLWKFIYKHSLNFDKLIFISRFAKEEFADFFHKHPMPQNKVIYGGIDEIFFKPSKKRPKKYDFIHIARNIEHKNFRFILQILKHFNDKKLLRIREISSQDASFIKANNLKVSIVERCSAEDKKKYLEESKILLFPSLYEGFGLPPVEAAASNCYVLSANNTGLLESNLEENLLPLEKSIWIDRINKIFSEGDEEVLKKQKEFAESFRFERFLSEVEKFTFEE